MLCTLLSWSNYAFCFWSRRTIFRFTFFHGFKCHTACDLARNTLNRNESVYCNVQCAHGSKFNHQFPLHFHFDMNQPISKKKMARLNFFFIDISRYSILGGTHPTLFPSICGRMKYIRKVWGLVGSGANSNEKYVSMWCSCGYVAM